MRTPPAIASALLAALALWCAGTLADRVPPGAPPDGGAEELPLFPSGRLLDLVSLGRPTAAADLAWLTAVQYYGKHHLGDGRYPLAAHLFDVVTRCDPRFRSAYFFGALVLGEEANDMKAARALLRRGIAADPEDWMLPFQRGFLEYMHGEPALGAIEMARASHMRGAPGYAARIAAGACARTGREELAARLWEEMARSGDPASRALAEDRLRDLRRGGRS